MLGSLLLASILIVIDEDAAALGSRSASTKSHGLLRIRRVVRVRGEHLETAVSSETSYFCVGR